MKLAELLAEKRSTILKRWSGVLLASYPADTSGFLKKQKDHFANPVGGAIREGLEGLLIGLLQEADPEELSPFLDRIIRVRAVQNFSPAEALLFMFQLKTILRDILGDVQDRGLTEEWSALESRIDDLILQAFDIYSACREKLYEIRLNDETRRLHLLLRRAKLIVETEGDGVDLPDLRDSGLETK